MSKKVYARQIAPEYQESPLFAFGEEFPENIAVYGNRDYNEHFTGVFDGLRDALLDAGQELDNMRWGDLWRPDFITILHDLLPPVGRGEYSRAERLAWVKLLDAYGATEAAVYMARAAALITGQEYDAAQISGCCQGEWQNVIYPAEWGREWLAAFECEYWNTGEEWIFTDPLEAPPEDPGDVDGCAVYVHGWRDAERRAEIADAAGVDPADVVLYVFGGWERRAKYAEVGAE